MGIFKKTTAYAVLTTSVSMIALAAQATEFNQSGAAFVTAIGGATDNGDQTATAIGTDADANNSSVAVGVPSTANNNAVAVGNSATADNTGIAIGADSDAQTPNSIAIGNDASATGSNDSICLLYTSPSPRDRG